MSIFKTAISAHLSVLILLTALLLTPFFAEARTVVRSGDTVSIGQDQLIEGDLYTAASIVNISGQIEEDLLAAGADVTVNGEVGEDVFIIAGNVDVHGTIGDDLRVIGGTVIIAEPVLGDVFVVGSNVEILSTASIAGDLTIVGGSVTVNAPVEGRVLGWVENVRIDSVISGDIEITATQLTLGDNAVVQGDIQYVSRNQLIRSQSATIDGEVVRNDPVVQNAGQSATSIILPILILLFSVAAWFLVSRRLLQRVVNRALMPSIRPVLTGLATFILAPFVITVLLVSMLGTLLGAALLAFFVLFCILAMIAVPAVLAQWVMSLVSPNNATVSLLTLIGGTLLVVLCMLVPIVGPIILVGFFVLTLGSMIDLVLRANR